MWRRGHAQNGAWLVGLEHFPGQDLTILTHSLWFLGEKYGELAENRIGKYSLRRKKKSLH